MNTRNDLLDMERELEGHGSVCLSPDTAERWLKIVDKLIAERPYEPGEKVLFQGEECEFYCTHPESPNVYVLRDDRGSFRCASSNFVKSSPKTYRVTVPEEKIEQAKKAAARKNPYSEALGAALSVCDWLANPENWEDDR